MAKSGNLSYVTRIDPATEAHVPADGLRKVFVSYKKSDNIVSGIRDIIVKKILRLVNCAVWYDENLTPGVSYEQEIIDAISECDAVILLLTRDILESEFVWDIEIATARKQKKGIIPVAFGISEADFAEAEKRLGEKLQIMRWPKESAKGLISEDSMKFDDDFERALDRFVIDADLAMRIEQFFASNRHTVSLSQLSPEQKYLMGYGYLRGVGTEKNTEKGIGLLDSIAHIYGDDEETLSLKGTAAMELDKYYYEIDDLESSFKYSEIGAKAGNPASVTRLGFAYDMGLGVEPDKAKAIECYEKAADLGSADAANNLGVMYKNGEGVEQNTGKAMELYRKAAELGSTRAMRNLGMIYYNGEGVGQDMTKAAELYAKAADMGDIAAISGLGNMFYHGNGVPVNKQTAAELYTTAAENGDMSATYNLAVMYDDGEGVEQDKQLAAELYFKAAEMGHMSAAYNLALMFMNGDGIEKSDENAAVLFARAAELGHISAANNLGVMYYNGIGVPVDFEKAFELFSYAAEMGYADALFNIAMMYSKGEGVEKNAEKAVELLYEAAEMGSDNARKMIESFENEEGEETCEEPRKLTKKEIREAKKAEKAAAKLAKKEAKRAAKKK